MPHTKRTLKELDVTRVERPRPTLSQNPGFLVFCHEKQDKTFHASQADAEAEAELYASENPHKSFIVMQAVAEFTAAKNPVKKTLINPSPPTASEED